MPADATQLVTAELSRFWTRYRHYPRALVVSADVAAAAHHVVRGFDVEVLVMDDLDAETIGFIE
jgi:hypothetical protein